MPQFTSPVFVRRMCVLPIKTHRSIPSHPYSTPKQPPCPPFTPLSPTQHTPPSALCAQGHSFLNCSFRAHPPFITCTHTPHSIHNLPEARASSPSPPRVQWRMRSHDRFFYCALVHDHLLTHTTPLLPRRSPSPLAPPHSKPHGCLYPHQYPPQSSFSTHNPSTAAPLIAPGAIT